MCALSLKYIVMIQAGYEKAMQLTVADGVVRFRVNNNIKKELQVRIGKKKERKGGAISHLHVQHWTGQKNVWLLQHDVQCHML